MSNDIKIAMGELAKPWEEKVNNITFSVTEDCNLACKYCYMTGKNSKKKMSFETAKKVVDYVLTNGSYFNETGVVWDFIGGEPFLEIDLIDLVTDYIKQQMFILDHPWFDCYRLNFSTNGILYDMPKVQEYIRKNKGHISIGISLDGNKTKHDLQRVKSDGSGSYDDVIRNVPLWLKQCPGEMVKSTFASEDLQHLKDSIISIWENGIKIVAANVVFEDVWQEGDDIVFENQLKELADYVIKNELWKEYSVRFFDPNIGFPLLEDNLKSNYCGAGKMLAVDCEGKFYPCIRFLDFALSYRKGICIGDADHGINLDKVRPFLALNLCNVSKEECINCDVASGCAWCTGLNYDVADTDTIYQRATYICKMHKANVRANEYFWKEFEKATGQVSPREERRRDLMLIMPEKINKNNMPKYLQFITDDNITPHCIYRNQKKLQNKMDDGIMRRGLEFAEKNGYKPVFLGKAPSENGFNIINADSSYTNNNSILVYDNSVNSNASQNCNCILLINKSNINKIYEFIIELIKANSRVNIVLEDIESFNEMDIKNYDNELDKLVHVITEEYSKGNMVEINSLTDRLNIKSMHNCDCGKSSFALAPNGKFYICPAFYFDNPDDSIGDLDKGISIKNEYLLELSTAPICTECDAYQCKRCKFLNKKLTNEINTPSKIQCMISHIERNKSRSLQLKLIELNSLNDTHMIPEINYLDPFEKIVSNKYFPIKSI